MYIFNNFLKWKNNFYFLNGKELLKTIFLEQF